MTLSADFKSETVEKVEKYAIGKGISKSEALRQLTEAGLQIGGDLLTKVEEMVSRFSLDMGKKFDALEDQLKDGSAVNTNEEIKKQADRLAKMIYVGNVDSRTTVYFLKSFLKVFYEKTQKMDEETKQQLTDFIENQVLTMYESSRKDLSGNQKNKVVQSTGQSDE